MFIYIHPKELNAGTRVLYTHVHSSIMHKTKRWKQPKCPSTEKGISKVSYPTSSGIVSMLKKEGNWQTCNMDESWGHDAKQNKPVIEINIQYDSSFMRYLEYSKSETPSWMVVARVLGKKGMKSYCLIGRVSVLQKEKSSGDEWWPWLHSNGNVFNVELYSQKLLRW